MEEINEEITNFMGEKVYEGSAKRLMELLSPILENSNSLKERWMWELLQNASDLGNAINANFEITNDRLIFSHNGKYFSISEALNLIMPNSSKDELNGHQQEVTKSSIGKFGTGFISTHILSKIVEVASVFTGETNIGNYRFNFKLDRSNRCDKASLISSIKNSYSEFMENSELTNDLLNTSFTYYIDQPYDNLQGQEIVNYGLERLKILLPYVFTFRPQLNTIKILDNIEQITWRFEREEVESGIDGLIIIKTVCYNNDKLFNSTLVGNIIKEGATIAFPISECNGENKFKILPFPDNCPKLFCAFPMIGTNDFNFPVIVHSETFFPSIERNGIKITSNDSRNKTNRKILVESKDAYIRLLEIIEKYEWEDAFNICKLSSVEIDDNETKLWFSQNIFDPIIVGILKTKMVETEINRLSLSKIYIPYADRRLNNYSDIVKSIYVFAFKTIPNLLPKKEHYYKWFEIINFEIFQEQKLDLNELTAKISKNVNTLEEFHSRYSMKETEAITFLIQLIEFILLQNKKKLLDEHKLTLNQSKNFCFLKELKLDFISHKNLNVGYEEKLKDIHNSISKSNCREHLLDRDFEKINNLIDNNYKVDFKILAEETDKELKKYNGSIQNEFFLEIFRTISHWYDNCGLSQETLLDLFPHFSSKRKSYYFDIASSEEQDNAFDILISGKSAELAALANSSISKEQIAVFTKNPATVAVVFSLAANNTPEDIQKLIVLDNDIKDIGKDKFQKIMQNEKQKKQDFWFKKLAGDKFEGILRTYFEQLGLGYEIIKTEGAFDYKVVCNQNNNIYYLELKSITRESKATKIKMSHKQGVAANKYLHNYALCVLETPPNWNAIANTYEGLNYFRNNCKIVVNIGSTMQGAYLESKQFNDNLVKGNINGVGVEFADNNFYFTIKRTIWENGTNLEGLIKKIDAYMR